uniref:hypothetical protein n=1 Tax=Streptomyces sp. IBSBF 2390 TaxID=2903533 RepID=UPI002FDBA671
MLVFFSVFSFKTILSAVERGLVKGKLFKYHVTFKHAYRGRKTQKRSEAQLRRIIAANPDIIFPLILCATT